MKKTPFAIACSLALCFSGAALAQDKDNTIRIGAARVAPHSTASDLRDLTGPFTPPGLSFKVQDATTMALSFERRLTPNWSVEFAMGVPPKLDSTLVVKTPLIPASFNGQVASTVTQYAPTVFANYKFLDESSSLRPYLGVGLNYSKFANPTSTAANDLLSGGPTSLSLKDSYGLAAQAGVAYQIDSRWSINAAVATARVKTVLTTTTSTPMGPIRREADLSFKPRVFVLSAGYSF